MADFLSKVKVDEQLFLRERIGLEDGTELLAQIKLFDKDEKELCCYEEELYVENKRVELPFKIESIAKDNDVELDEIHHIVAAIDVDSDGKMTKREEVRLQIIPPDDVKITIIVELPHSKETGWGAKGLAGHTAMAIGNRFFDYGPDYDPSKTFDEKQYQADLNQDGDMKDKVKIDNIPNAGFYFAPGRPWWGEAIALRNNKKAINVKLDEVIHFITKLPWETNRTTMVQGTYIYGTVYKIEFYVKKSESNKMLEWWENRYKHLKIYSVKPWTGEQCTTAVKEALAYGGIDDIDWNTLTPDGILEDLKTEIKSTSIKHKDEKAKVTLIKKEATDWKP